MLEQCPSNQNQNQKKIKEKLKLLQKNAASQKLNCQRDGFLTIKISMTPKPKASQQRRSIMKPIASATTTILSKAATGIGTPHGEHGLATRSNSDAVAAWLAGKRPADMDKAAVSRASSRGVGLTVRYESRYPVGENGEHIPGYMVAVGCETEGSSDAMQAALDDLRNFMTPAPMRKIEEWIARMSVITAKRRDDAFSEELRVTEYASRLARYPADIVRTVLLEDTYKFFPAWDELRRRCETLSSPRRQMIAALERGPRQKDPSYRAATDAEKARIQAMVDEMFPGQSQEDRDRAVAEVTKGNCIEADQ